MLFSLKKVEFTCKGLLLVIMKHDRIILQQQPIVAVSENACSFDQFKFIVVFVKCLNMSLKRKRSSLKDKIDIIEESDKYNLSLRKLAEKFGFGKDV